MAKSGKKTFGVPNSFFIVLLVVVAGFVGFHLYSTRSKRQAMRARAIRRVMLARRVH